MDRQAPREPEGRGDAGAQTSTTQLAAKTRRGVLVGGLGALSAIALLHPTRAPANAARGLRRQRPQGGEAFVPFPARLPAAVGGTVARFVISVEDRTIEIAPGVRFRAWTFNGRVPGPVLHVRQGQRVEITFHNRGMMPHSFDLHAARVAAGQGLQGRPAGQVHDPGVHCARPGCLRLPLRDEPGGHAHRGRHVRGDGGHSCRAAAAGRPRVRPAWERVVSERLGSKPAGGCRFREGTGNAARCGHVQRLRQSVRQPRAARAVPER